MWLGSRQGRKLQLSVSLLALLLFQSHVESVKETRLDWTVHVVTLAVAQVSTCRPAPVSIMWFVVQETVSQNSVAMPNKIQTDFVESAKK